MLSEAFELRWRVRFACTCEAACLSEAYETYALFQRTNEERTRRIEEAVEASHADSLACMKDAGSVLELRDWVCARVALSRRKKPLSPSEIRSCMEFLRAAPPEERSAVALRLVCVQACDLPKVQEQVDDEMMKEWMLKPPPPLTLTLAELARTIDDLHLRKTKPLSASDFAALQRRTGFGKLDALRFLHDQKFSSAAELWKKYAYANTEAEAAGSLEQWNDALVHETSVPVPPLEDKETEPPCAATEFALLMQDGSLLLPDQTSTPPAAACKELGRVVAAAASPLSSCIVAIVAGEKRSLVLWSAYESSSYATAHVFPPSALDDCVDVQLTADGDMLVQTAQRGKDGKAAAAVSTFCFRIAGIDLSTLQHVPVPPGSDELLWRRRFGGEINHLNHGNLLALHRTCAWGLPSGDTDEVFRSTSRVVYADTARTLPTHWAPYAVWGNPRSAYVFHDAEISLLQWSGPRNPHAPTLCSAHFLPSAPSSVAVLRLAPRD